MYHTVLDKSYCCRISLLMQLPASAKDAFGIRMSWILHVMQGLGLWEIKRSMGALSRRLLQWCEIFIRLGVQKF